MRERRWKTDNTSVGSMWPYFETSSITIVLEYNGIFWFAWRSGASRNGEGLHIMYIEAATQSWLNNGRLISGPKL